MDVERSINEVDILKILESDIEAKKPAMINKEEDRGYADPNDTIHDLLRNSFSIVGYYDLGIVKKESVSKFLDNLRDKVSEIAEKRGDMPNALERANEIWEATINHPEVTDPRIKALNNPFLEERPTQT